MASNKDLKEAQQGANVPPMATSPVTPQLDFASFDAQFGGYTPPPNMFSNLQGRSQYTPSSPVMAPRKSGLKNLIQETSKPGNKGAGSRITTQDEYEGSGRYDYFQPTSMGVDNEELAAQYQSFGSKAVNGVTKGSILAVNTFLQSTVGLVNGTYQAIADGKFSSFQDHSLDENFPYKLLHTLLGTNIDNVFTFKINTTNRRLIMEMLLRYMLYHDVINTDKLNSIKILQSLYD